MLQQSEIAQLKQRIIAEYEAAQRALHGLSYGTAQHRFINERLENMERYRRQLEDAAGPEATKKVMCELGNPSEGTS